ncbi:type VI secretion system effector [Enterobacter asburiae]|nr:type VI secretion system effector [Enterobacter asburiae]
MAIPGYMSLTDDAGNIIKGSVKVTDRENQIEVLGLYLILTRHFRTAFVS